MTVLACNLWKGVFLVHSALVVLLLLSLVSFGAILSPNMLQNLAEWLLDLSDTANDFPHLTATASDNFELWFRSNGGYINPAIEITSSISDGTFLRVDGDAALHPGATIISCPHKLTISWPSIRKYHLNNISSSTKPHVATRLFLMKQYILRERSPWWPYIKSIPQPYQNDAFNTPLYYNASDMAWIRGTNLEYARQVREDAWRKEYNDAMQETFRKKFTAEDGQVWTWFACTTSQGFILADQSKGALSMGRHDYDLPVLSRSGFAQSG